MDCLRVQRTSSISKHRKLRQDLLLDELEDLYGRRRPEMTSMMASGSSEDVFSRESGVMAEAPKFERGDIVESIVGDFLDKVKALNYASPRASEAVVNGVVGGEDVEKGDSESDSILEGVDDDEEESGKSRNRDLRMRVEKTVTDFRSHLFANAKAFVHLVIEYLKNIESMETTARSARSGGGSDNVSGVNQGRKSSISSLLGGRSSSSRPTSPGVVKIDFINEFLEGRGFNAKDDLILLVSTAERFKPGFNEVFFQNFGSFFKRSSWVLR